MRSKVLILVKGLGLGGVERLLASSIPHLDRDSYEYEVAFLTPWKDDVVSEFEDSGISVTCLDVSSDVSPSNVSKIRAFLRDGRFDIVHTHSPLPAAIARVVSGRPTGGFVHTEHSLPRSRKWLTRLANRATYRRCDVAISVSRVVEAQVVSNPIFRPRRSVVIHGGIDTEELKRQAADESVSVDRLDDQTGWLTVGNVAHLRSQKGHVDWLKAAQLIVGERPKTRFVIVGREKEPGFLAMLENEARQLQIEDHVVFAGFQPNPYPLMVEFDLFMFASHFEGFPIALVEAMSLGLPFVATNVGGVPEAAGPEMGRWLSAPSRPDLLARNAVEMLSDDGLRQEAGAANQTRATAEFSISQMVKQTEAIYSELLAR